MSKTYIYNEIGLNEFRSKKELIYSIDNCHNFISLLPTNTRITLVKFPLLQNQII